MPTVYVLDGPDLGKQVRVESGAVLGRNPDCAVQVRHRSVSRRHARIEEQGGRWHVVDLGSRNGVFVADERVERHLLSDGIELRLGEVALRIRLEDAEVADELPHAEQTLVGNDEIELEEEIELELDGEPEGSSEVGRTAVRTRPAPRPLEIEPEKAVSERAASRRSSAPPPSAALSEREERRARVLGEMQRQSSGGLFAGDLSQQPLWLRALIYAIALVVLAVAFFGVFVGMRTMRGG